MFEVYYFQNYIPCVREGLKIEILGPSLAEYIYVDDVFTCSASDLIVIKYRGC
jgi:hypothetical protein